MTEQVCDVPECTFPQTGTCMKSYVPEECPSHIAALSRLGKGPAAQTTSPAELSEENSADGANSIGSGEPVLAAPTEKPSLPRSGTMGLTEANALMQRRYVNLIGIFGIPDAGKTACLTSLYLLLARGVLAGFSFAGSNTLMAFEEISRGTRRWNNGNAPDEMTVHTELADDRQAGFLHLRLRRELDGSRFDLLMPDLPGEWSTRLINSGEAKRFSFLSSVEVIWLMANGSDFLDGRTRELAIHRMTNLIERLAHALPGTRPKIVLVTSWRDKGELSEPTLQRIRDCSAKFGFELDFAPIASFSDTDMQPGNGLADLVEKTLSSPRTRLDFWPTSNLISSRREFLNFGSRP